jgi:hypothetical protein
LCARCVNHPFATRIASSPQDTCGQPAGILLVTFFAFFEGKEGGFIRNEFALDLVILLLREHQLSSFQVANARYSFKTQVTCLLRLLVFSHATLLARNAHQL